MTRQFTFLVNPASGGGAAPGDVVPIPVGADGEPLGMLPGLVDDPAVIEIQPGTLSIVC